MHFPAAPSWTATAYASGETDAPLPDGSGSLPSVRAEDTPFPDGESYSPGILLPSSLRVPSTGSARRSQPACSPADIPITILFSYKNTGQNFLLLQYAPSLLTDLLIQRRSGGLSPLPLSSSHPGISSDSFAPLFQWL